MKKVTIVGTGVAGMTAALRLLERGYSVTMYEQDDFIGGMLGARKDAVTGTMREHSYHMFPNWYYNFWKIAEEIGIKGNFTPRDSFRFLRGDGKRPLPALFNPGGPQDMLRNLASGAAPPPDLFVFMYSMIDMLAEPPPEDGLLDEYSVNGFLRSRPYMTETAAELHRSTWQTVWAISSSQASMRSYRTFILYANRVSVPELWLLAGNKYDALMKPWLEKLESHGDRFRLHKLKHLRRVIPSADGARIDKLEFVTPNRSPSIHHDDWKPVGKPRIVNVADQDVILALTPGGLARLVRGALYNADPRLGEVRYLQAEPMGTMELYFKTRHEGLSNDVTILTDAPYSMTYLDYSQLWPDQDATFLYVTVSDVIPLLGLPEEARDANGDLTLDLDHPRTAIDYVMRAFRKKMPFDMDDVDLRRSAFETNTGEALFANLVGSWKHRPEVVTGLENLWLSGTFLKNFVDVATIEGAVVSGLETAEAIRARRTPDEPEVTTRIPEAFPQSMYKTLRAAWAPAAANAKLWSDANAASGGKATDWRPFLAQLPGRAPDLPDYLGSLFWNMMPASRWSDPVKGLGPLYWDYDPDGRRKASGTGGGGGGG